MEKVRIKPKLVDDQNKAPEIATQVKEKVTFPSSPVDQLAITVIAPVNPARLEHLRLLLKNIRDQDIETNPILPFKGLKGVHFCRFLILDGRPDIDDEKYPDQLVYAANFDESEQSHFRAITEPAFLSGYYEIFSCCLGMNNALGKADAVIAFIKQNKKEVHTFYRGHRGLSLQQIKNEDAVYRSIQDFLKTTTYNSSSDVQAIKKDIENHLKSLPFNISAPTIQWKHQRIPQVALIYLGIPILILVLLLWWLNILTAGLVILGLLLTGVAFYLRSLERSAKELKDEGDEIKQSQQNASELIRFEDHQIQNQLSHLVELRPGLFRRTLQVFALAALSKLAVVTYNKGRLGDIATIHFARWSMIDGGRRLLFFSNFDGSWENYLGDFVDRAAVGLTLAWSNTKEFPKTRWLILDGATNEELFKTWTRKYQVKTQVWYTAYKHLTVKNILRNHDIALGIGKDMTTEEVKRWLKLL